MKEGVATKIKPIDNEHLMVILSRSESHYLGIYPTFSSYDFYVRCMFSRIFMIACSCCDFMPKGNKVKIQVQERKNGDIILLFSESAVKKYRIKKSSTLLICVFPDCDALIVLMKQLKKSPIRFKKMRLFYDNGQYIAVAYRGTEDIQEMRTFLGEYANIKIATRCKLEAITKNGKNIGEIDLNNA